MREVLIRKAVTFRASSIGDCLMGKYLLENVHAQFPEAKLCLVVSSRGDMIRDLMSGFPYIEVIEASRRNIKGLMLLWQKFRASDLVVTQYAGKPGGAFSLTSKVFARLLAKRGGLIGFKDSFRFNTSLYDKLVDNVLGVAPAELERKALQAAGVPSMFMRPTLHIKNEVNMRDKFGIKGAYIVVHLFAGNKGRGISPEKKIALLQALVEALPGKTLVVTGGSADADEAEQAVQDLPVVLVADQTSVQEMTALMEQSIGVVSVDTGAAHIAAQLGTPLVVLATCLGLHWWKPEQYGANSPVTLLTHPEPETHVYKDYPDCIEKIDNEEVARVARNYFLVNK